MSVTWQGEAPPETGPPGLGGYLRMGARGAVLIVVLAVGLALHGVLRLIERPFAGASRPLSPFVTQAVCRIAFWVLAIGYSRRGTPLRGAGAVVSNHASWLDIFALNAGKRITFVSKHEVAGWFGIGLLARATGTIFIRRERREAGAQVRLFRERLALGQRLLFFPEGTSSDSITILPFKSTLFAAFFAPGLAESLMVQPVTLRYVAPAGQDRRFYGWWGDMAFGTHLAQVLAAPRQGRVEVIYHRPVAVARFQNRKALAAHCEQVVRAGLDGKV